MALQQPAPSQRRRLLIADDDPTIRRLLVTLFSDEGYDAFEAGDGAGVLAALSQHEPHLVLLDVRMPGVTGLDALTRALGAPTRPGVIMMTAFSTANEAIRAIQAGAYDYIAKPFNVDEVAIKVACFFDQRALERELSALTTARLAGRDPAERLIGDSPAMREVYKLLGRVAASEATVLLTGETGTGKEVVAEMLHQNSTYARGPLVKVNCAALPETLLESELFGHEKGAFTGAIAQRKGRFELAHKGTIFLDEIGEVSPSTQKKLLRVLQERSFERVGGSVALKVDARVIAATNKRLEEEVGAGRFRDDLFYRLNVIAVHLPPLRERREDIPLLMEHFLDRHRYAPASPPARVSEPALAKLLRHDWPGNVRELQNTLERATALAQGGLVLAEHVRFPALGERAFIDVAQRVRERTPLARLLDETARAAIAEALRQADGDWRAAATNLALEPDAIRQQATALGVSAPGSQAAAESSSLDGKRDVGGGGPATGVAPLPTPLVALSAAEREQLDDCIRREPRARRGRRLQAIGLLADGKAPTTVASRLGCSISSVYNWASAWRRMGVAGLEETPHGGRPRSLDETAESLLERLLADEPRRHGVAAPTWTVLLLRDALERAGHPTSERTVRRLMRRLGFGWRHSEPSARPLDLASEGQKGQWRRVMRES